LFNPGLAALILAWLSIGSALIYISRSKNKAPILGYLSLGFALAPLFLSAAFAILAYYFLAPDFEYYYVMTKTSSDTPAAYRLGALWSGQAGIFLIWSWVVSVTALIIKRRGLKNRFHRRTCAILLLLCLFLVSLLLFLNPFERSISGVKDYAAERGLSTAELLAYYERLGIYSGGRFIDGYGLEPSLLSPFMVMHPPLLFTAFGFLAVPFAFSLAFLLTGIGSWEKPSRPWARSAWLLMTLGIALGGYWSYTELPEAAYWRWDPVEIASLLPWLLLTAYLHSSSKYRKNREFRVLSPLLAVFVVISIFFAAFITRSGLLESYHAYTGPYQAAAMGSAVLFLTVYAIYYGLKRTKKTRVRVSTASLNILCFVVLGLLLTWSLLFLAVNKGRADNPLPYGRVFYPFAYFLTILLGFDGLKRVIGGERALRISLGVAGLSFIAAALGGHAASYIPAAVFGFAGLAFRARSGSAWIALHGGFLIALLGIVLSGNPFSSQVYFSYPWDLGEEKDVGLGYAIKLVNIKEQITGRGDVEQVLELHLSRGGESRAKLLAKHVYYKSGGHRPEPGVYREAHRDLTVVYHGPILASERELLLPVEVKVTSFANLLWLGISLLVLGIVAALFKEKLISRGR
jgi:cytochrome c-type biogenesis protein CcmF